MASSHCAALADLRDFQVRVDYYLKKKAVEVMAESDETTNHADRVVFSREVFDGRVRIYDIALAVTTNASIASTIGTKDAATANTDIVDNDLSYVVMTEMFNAFADN
jgi:hypothetical protein